MGESSEFTDRDPPQEARAYTFGRDLVKILVTPFTQFSLGFVDDIGSREQTLFDQC